MSENKPVSGLRRKLYIIIFEADTKGGRLFDVILLWAILISVAAVILESDQNIMDRLGLSAWYLEWFLTGLFTLEFFLRVYVSEKPLSYILSFFGLVDLVSIVPAYLSLIFPGTHYFMIIRVLRLLRIFRILKLVRFLSAARALNEALKESYHKIMIFWGAMLSIILILSTCMYIVETQEGFSTIPKSMYWTIVTMTTVGYGDVVPITTLGKFVASFMMLTGYAIIAVPTGIVTTELAESNKKKRASEVLCKRCKAKLYENANYCHSCGEKS